MITILRVLWKHEFGNIYDETAKNFPGIVCTCHWNTVEKKERGDQGDQGIYNCERGGLGDAHMYMKVVRESKTSWFRCDPLIYCCHP